MSVKIVSATAGKLVIREDKREALKPKETLVTFFNHRWLMKYLSLLTILPQIYHLHAPNVL